MQLSHRVMRGFTLLELMVVIAIISILASLSAPTFTRQISKAKLIEAQNLATQHQTLVEEFILLYGYFPSTADFNLIKLTLTSSSIAKSISVSDQSDSSGSILITFNTTTGISENQFMRYTRNTEKHWNCFSDISENILPPQCESISGEDE